MDFFSLYSFSLAPVFLFSALYTMNKRTRVWLLKRLALSSVALAVFRVTSSSTFLYYGIKLDPISLWCRSGDDTLTINLLALPLSSVFLASLAFDFTDCWFPKKELPPTPQFRELSDVLREISATLLVNVTNEEVLQANAQIRRDIKDIRDALQVLRTHCQDQPIPKRLEGMFAKLTLAMKEKVAALRSARVHGLNQGFD